MASLLEPAIAEEVADVDAKAKFFLVAFSTEIGVVGVEAAGASTGC